MLLLSRLPLQDDTFICEQVIGKGHINKSPSPSANIYSHKESTMCVTDIKVATLMVKTQHFHVVHFLQKSRKDS